jgi:hypothetical protein
MKQILLIVWTLLSFVLVPSALASDTTTVAKPSVYQGTTVKLDILSPVLIPALHHWHFQHYELAANVRLANRFYPTLELGYATPGGFARIGCDINPLKKSAASSPHALLVGVRVGTSVQARYYTDAWGEIVAGCQVEIAKVHNTAFYMGWMGRLKFLFTPREMGLSTYVPGYGKRQHMGWGFNYHIGWRF